MGYVGWNRIRQPAPLFQELGPRIGQFVEFPVDHTQCEPLVGTIRWRRLVLIGTTRDQFADGFVDVQRNRYQRTGARQIARRAQILRRALQKRRRATTPPDPPPGLKGMRATRPTANCHIRSSPSLPRLRLRPRRSQPHSVLPSQLVIAAKFLRRSSRTILIPTMVSDSQEALCLSYRTVKPDPLAAKTYDRLYALYKRLCFGFGHTAAAVEAGDVLPTLRRHAAESLNQA